MKLQGCNVDAWNFEKAQEEHQHYRGHDRSSSVALPSLRLPVATLCWPSSERPDENQADLRIRMEKAMQGEPPMDEHQTINGQY
jgi:hypothetical protein